MVRARSILIGVALAGAAMAAGGAFAVACQPNLDDTVSILTTPTVLAVQATPAEAPPTTPINYTALVADGDGSVPHVPHLQWDYCNARNPLRNLGPVSPACVDPSNAQLTLIGYGVEVGGTSAEIPSLTCSNFGPNPPQLQEGGVDGSVGRPVDPDTTGGYYQPVSVFLPVSGGAPQVTLYPTRISCGFAGAGETASALLQGQYHLNVNPQVASLTLLQHDAGGTELMDDTTNKTNAVRAGQTVTFRVAWPACPLQDKCGDGVCGANESARLEIADASLAKVCDCVPPANLNCGSFSLDAGTGLEASVVNCVPPLYSSGGAGLSCPSNCANLIGGCPVGCNTPAGCPDECKAPQGCAGAERYVNLDPTTGNVVYQREGIQVSWYATAGTFESDSTGRAGTDDATTNDDAWTAPSTPGPVHLWVVLHDDRHGVGWAGYALNVTK